MSAIPLHLQRRFEQRWAGRFVPTVATAAKGIVPKGIVNRLPPKATRVPAGEGQNHFAEPTKPA